MQFAVKAVKRLESATLILEAPDVGDARRQAEQQGYSVIDVRSRGPGGTSWRRLAFGKLGFSVSAPFPLVQFNQSLLTLLRAGLSLVESIDALAARETRPEVRTVLARVLSRLYEGVALSGALADQPQAFPPLYVATVRANEVTGTIDEAIERYIHYRTQIEMVRKRVIGAAIYPALILAVGGLVILFLLLYVVPRFSQVFEDLGDRIPDMSRMLLAWGRFVHDHGILVLAIGLGVLLAIPSLLAQPRVRAKIGRLITRIPSVGAYVHVYHLARFYRTLGMLLRGGIPIVPALDMVEDLLSASMREPLDRARTAIREGQPMSSALDAHGLTTAVSLRMLRVGERTGQMGEMMERIAGFYDDDLEEAIEWFIRLFEPLLMIALGLIIGVIVLLMYAPIFELAGSIQ